MPSWLSKFLKAFTGWRERRPAERVSIEPGHQYSASTRPDHAERLRTLKAQLSEEVLGALDPSGTAMPDPSGAARYGVAGCLNQQLALAQKIGLPKDALESALRSPFVLGYIVGSAAWHADRYSVPRPGPEADKLVLYAYREVLGPLNDIEIASISDDASCSPAFADGMSAAAAELDALAAGQAPGAYGLVRFLSVETNKLP